MVEDVAVHEVAWAQETPAGVEARQHPVRIQEKQRLAQYFRINKLWLDDQPAAPLYQQIDLYGASKRVNWKARSDELIKAYDMSLK